MSYLHHEEADFAASELARMFDTDPSLCFEALPSASRPSFSAYATQEPSKTNWPLADGVISLVRAGGADQDDIALEFKRVAEGTHGLLTAVGQSLAYIDKGYNGSVIVIPSMYSSHSNPASHVKSILDNNGIDGRIGVFAYHEPDKSSPYPFRGRITCVRPLTVGPALPGRRLVNSRPSTQWAHLREGSTTRDVAFCYLKSAIRLYSGGADKADYGIPAPMTAAIARIDPRADSVEFLSYTSDSSFGSRVWRDFWLTYVATSSVLTPFVFDGSTYVPPAAFTEVQKDDGTGKSQIFEGRANGLKETICAQLNNGVISEDEAWEMMAAGVALPGTQNKQGVRSRAHSFREDVDSSLAQLKWIDNSGHPTDQGYRFVNICERYGGANTSAAINYFGATLIQTGHYGTFLHYVHRLSEEIFMANPVAFAKSKAGISVFDEDSYWSYLEVIEEKMRDDLRVIRKVSGRSRPRTRTIFQAELTFLRKYGFIPEGRSERYRLGVGLPVNWIRVHEAMQIEL